MPVAWYVVPYLHEVKDGRRSSRRLEIDDVLAVREQWSEVEAKGDRAIVKISTSAANLSTLDALFYRLPVDRLTNLFSGLDNAQIARLDAELIDQGYSRPQITASLGTNFRLKTLGDYLEMMASHRIKPRYDSATDSIVFDGAEVATESVSELNRRI